MPEDEGTEEIETEALASFADPALVVSDLPTEFDEKYKESFEGLLYIGALSDQFEWLGHVFRIRTLNSDELLLIPLIIKEWENTIGHQRAYAVARVALSTVSVDGKMLPTPVEETDLSHQWAFDKFNHVKSRWYPTTVDVVYNRLMVLEAQVGEVIKAMGNALGQTES